MSIVSDTIARARARAQADARTPALPIAVYVVGRDADTGIMHRRLIAATFHRDLIAGIDPDKGPAACDYVQRWIALHHPCATGPVRS